MRVSVTARGDASGLEKFKNAAETRSDLSFEFFVAPKNIDYVLPFPIVVIQYGDMMLRQYGKDAEALFFKVVSNKGRVFA
jgi:hypothetical protein